MMAGWVVIATQKVVGGVRSQSQGKPGIDAVDCIVLDKLYRYVVVWQW